MLFIWDRHAINSETTKPIELLLFTFMDLR